ncbi:MAG TPA: ABC transporter permease [Pyrinomonadaceae bacterium]|nr:ABC transporter permease [Pyrinomonadaceae bacterium]
MIESLFKEIRYGIRSLLKRPGATALALITLALGIGANTAIFSAVDSVLLRPLPLKDSERLVSIWEHTLRVGVRQNEVAPANFFDLRNQNQVFQDIGAYGPDDINMTGGGEPEHLDGQLVTANVFSILGVEPALGRTFLANEDQPGQDRVVVLSDALWQRRFNRDPSIINRNITLNGESFTVVGVMPRGFFFPEREIELWTPWAMEPEQKSGRGDHYLRLVARLKPGATLERVNADIDAIAQRLSSEYPRTNEGLGFVAHSLHQDYVGSLRSPMLILFAAVALVLLIACVNVANLLLAQATSRRKEIAIRIALGARRWTIVRQLLTESLLLAGAGGLLGVLGAFWGVQGLTKLLPASLSKLQDVNIDARVFLFTLGVSVLTALVFGGVPALLAARTKPGTTLSDVARDTGGGTSGCHVRRVLVVSEVALAVVLLVGAGLLIRSFQLLRQVNTGFTSDNVLTMRMVLPMPKYAKQEARRAFYDEALRRVSELPGVESAGIITFLPLSFNGMNFSFSVEGRTSPGDMKLPFALYRVVSPDYFRTMGIPLQRGRFFDAYDTADSQPVILISRRLAEQYWPGEDPTGKRLKIGPVDSPNPWLTVAGVVGDVRQAGLYGEERMDIYAPYAQERRSFISPRDLVVRTKGDPASVAGAVRRAVWAVDKDQPISNVRTMDQVFAAAISKERFQTLLLGLFAALALVLASVGLYGVISYSVVQRTHEIGVRVALGAQSNDVIKLVIRQGMMLTLVGLVVGIGTGLVAARVLSDMLFGVTTTDPLTFGVVLLLLLLVAFLACYVPARRATKVDPLVALRYE